MVPREKYPMVVQLVSIFRVFIPQFDDKIRSMSLCIANVMTEKEYVFRAAVECMIKVHKTIG